MKSESNEPAIRAVMMPRDLNHQGAVFGGVILSYIDQAGFVEAKRQAYHKYVTASIGRVDFKNPIHCGDIVSFYAKTIKTGNTSITVQVDVFVDYLDGEQHQRVQVTEAEITYVALDRNNRPTPVFCQDDSGPPNTSES